MHFSISGYAQRTTPVVGIQPDGSILLPNGQTITPQGTQITVNDRPLGIAVSPDNTTAAIVTGSNFQTNAIHFVNLATKTITQTINGNTFVGVAFSNDGKKLYVGGGTDNNVKILTLDVSGQWSLAQSVAIPSAQPSGLSLSERRFRLCRSE
jgi:DNA-binding beta-propeller fold protein YncE